MKGKFVPPTGKMDKGAVKRLIKTLFSFYPVLIPLTIVCILFSAIVSSIPSVFMQKIIAIIEDALKNGISYDKVGSIIIGYVLILVMLYVLSLLSNVIYNQLLAIITQGSLAKLRIKMFNNMQNLPIKYFDTNNHGDVMSYYTNDIDTLRQMISQSFPNLLISIVTVTTVISLMLFYSVWMTLVVVLGVSSMIFVTKKIGGGSAKYFIAQQKAIGKTEGFIEEMMNGQKVIKVFCHEEKIKEDFDKVNEELFFVSEKANNLFETASPIIIAFI